MTRAGVRSRCRRGVVAGVACLALIHGAAVAAQSHALSGVVVGGAGGEPLRGVLVYANGTIAGVTDDDGRFRLEGLDTGTSILLLRRIGFAPLTFAVWVADTTPPLSIALEPQAIRLDDVNVESRVVRRGPIGEFDERRQSGMGFFYTRERIEKRRAVRTIDLLRTVPGLSIGPNPVDGTIMIVSRRASDGIGMGCPAAVFIDGMLMDVGSLSFIYPDDLEGVEVYRGPSETPMRYSGVSRCGPVILLWTRVGRS